MDDWSWIYKQFLHESCISIEHRRIIIDFLETQVSMHLPVFLLLLFLYACLPYLYLLFIHLYLHFLLRPLLRHHLLLYSLIWIYQNWLTIEGVRHVAVHHGLVHLSQRTHQYDSGVGMLGVVDVGLVVLDATRQQVHLWFDEGAEWLVHVYGIGSSELIGERWIILQLIDVSILRLDFLVNNLSLWNQVHRLVAMLVKWVVVGEIGRHRVLSGARLPQRPLGLLWSLRCGSTLRVLGILVPRHLLQ